MTLVFQPVVFEILCPGMLVDLSGHTLLLLTLLVAVPPVAVTVIVGDTVIWGTW